MSSPPPLSTTLKALAFDVFGTCVDWHTPIVSALSTRAQSKLTSPSFPSLPQATQSRLRSLTAQDWSRFAHQWRASYGAFTRTFVPGTTPWKDIDTHHHDSLLLLLEQWDLRGVYDEEELARLSKSWHFLAPWPDSSDGLRRLSERFVTASLSNGNRALLEDLDLHAGLGFRSLISAEDFRAYKPNPAVYLGACRELGVQPGEVAMVAAHLKDLAAARELGMRTVYVERPGEEEWEVDDERYVRAKGWVDLWVAEGEGGFVEVARRLGV